MKEKKFDKNKGIPLFDPEFIEYLKEKNAEHNRKVRNHEIEVCGEEHPVMPGVFCYREKGHDKKTLHGTKDLEIMWG